MERPVACADGVRSSSSICPTSASFPELYHELQPTTLPEVRRMASAVKQLFSTVLDLPPSCVEFSSSNSDYFVVGTYNLEKEDPAPALGGDNDEDERRGEIEREKEQSRSGSLILFKIAGEDLTLVETVPYPSAILDLHFSPHEPTLFALASSTGSISLYTLNPATNPAITHLQTFQAFPTTTLVLSLAFHPTDSSIIGVSLSTSNIALLHLDASKSTLTPLTSSLNHHSSLEAWTLAFSPSTPTPTTQTIYSGGDDSHLLSSTIPYPTPLLTSPTTTSTKRTKGHTAGVTAILPLPLPLPEPILLTGSYDDTIRVLATHDSDPSTHAEVLAELNLGGGVWRLKFLRDYSLRLSQGRKAAGSAPEPQFRVLASCMHAGARILEVRGSEEGEWSIQVLGCVEEHRSMCYGSDVQPLGLLASLAERLDDRTAVCVSTSFYDRLLCLWRFESDA